MSIWVSIIDVIIGTINDVLPIVVIVFGFQFFVLRRKPANFARLCGASVGCL